MEQSTILWQGTTASDTEVLTHTSDFVLDLNCLSVGFKSDEQAEHDIFLSVSSRAAAAAFTLIWQHRNLSH